MSLATGDLAHILVSLAVILTAAHGVGHLFVRFRQPRVIGEIVGGLALGPSLLGALAPHLQGSIFPLLGPSASVLGGIGQLGLLLLMYCSGCEVRSLVNRRDGRTVLSITGAGIALPFVAAALYLAVLGSHGLRGAAGGTLSFNLVFGTAMAVTSIPVISRIMLDLGILETSFARIVLSAAVIEDVVLYVVLAIALGVAASGRPEDFGLAHLLGVAPGSGGAIAYHVVVTVSFFAFFLVLGPGLYRRLLGSPANFLHQSSPVAFQLVLLLAMSALCLFLGVVPLFGAFLAGTMTSARPEIGREARHGVEVFARGLFVPVYFALVGLRLDLTHGFNVVFFVAFLGFACGVKALSVYGASRASGERPRAALNLAVAMNARGGPGIVLASVALDARIISTSFYACLVMLAIVTSLLAGSWLQMVVARGAPLRPSDDDETAATTAERSAPPSREAAPANI